MAAAIAVDITEAVAVVAVAVTTEEAEVVGITAVVVEADHIAEEAVEVIQVVDTAKEKSRPEIILRSVLFPPHFQAQLFRSIFGGLIFNALTFLWE